MPRKKNVAATSPAVQETPHEAAAPAAEPTPPVAAAAEPGTKWQGRSFKTTLSIASKGVTIGVRDGHDWVVSFPGDPGKEIKDRLMAAGFEYNKKKWKAFTYAGNRARVEGVVREIKAQLGDDMTVNEYNVKQVVIAFPGDPGEEVRQKLAENNWHFRPDATWNADFTQEAQKFARDLAQSLPDQSRSVAAGR